MTTAIAAPTIEATGLTKSYGRVEALRGAHFTAFSGEVVALVGDNGAGKSTLVKCLAGVVAPDSGRLALDGSQVAFSSPEAARVAGLETVYQDLALAPELDAASNLFIGRELLRPGILGRMGFLDKPAMRRQTHETFQRLSVGVQDPTVSVASLSGGQRQSVAVGRAVMWASKAVLMDEPTAALGVVQTARVRELIGAVRATGAAVVLVSHDLPFVFEVADRIEVLRLGRRVARLRVEDTEPADVIAAMTGVASFDGEEGE